MEVGIMFERLFRVSENPEWVQGYRVGWAILRFALFLDEEEPGRQRKSIAFDVPALVAEDG